MFQVANLFYVQHNFLFLNWFFCRSSSLSDQGGIGSNTKHGIGKLDPLRFEDWGWSPREDSKHALTGTVVSTVANKSGKFLQKNSGNIKLSRQQLEYVRVSESGEIHSVILDDFTPVEFQQLHGEYGRFELAGFSGQVKKKTSTQRLIQ